MSQPKPPSSNPAKDLKKSTQIYLKYLPQLLQAEQTARQTYDPQRIEEQQQLQAQYGPTQYTQQLAALDQLDPQGVKARNELADTVRGNLWAARAGQLPPGLQEAWDAQSGGRAAMYGNTTGAAPQAWANIWQGQNLLAQLQQAQQNVAGFLGLQTPEQAIGLIQPVTPDRASAYVNPSAPAQAAQNMYQNRLAQYQLAQGSGGSSTFGQVAGLVGAGVAGYYTGWNPQAMQAGYSTSSSVGNYFSDARKKNHIEYVGRSPKGHPIYEFCYDDVPDQRFRGTIAQELLATCPEACTLGADGFWRVDYSKTDIKLEQIPEEVLA